MWEPGKPSQNENEYFARQDAEWVKANRAKLDAERLVKEAGTSTGMTCPRCAGNLGSASIIASASTIGVSVLWTSTAIRATIIGLQPR